MALHGSAQPPRCVVTSAQEGTQRQAERCGTAAICAGALELIRCGALLCVRVCVALASKQKMVARAPWVCAPLGHATSSVCPVNRRLVRESGVTRDIALHGRLNCLVRPQLCVPREQRQTMTTETRQPTKYKQYQEWARNKQMGVYVL